MVYSAILRVIYVLIAVYDLEAEVFDVIAAYLHTDIPEGRAIYIRQPRGLDDGLDALRSVWLSEVVARHHRSHAEEVRL